MKHSKTIAGTITEKAIATFGKKVTKDNYLEWEQHWLLTARAWRDELKAEGLEKTTAKLNEIIEYEEKFIKSKLAIKILGLSA